MPRTPRPPRPVSPGSPAPEPPGPAELTAGLRQGSVLVTGISGYWGTRVALALEDDPRVGRILGIDSEAPSVAFRRTEVLMLRPKNPLLVDLLRHRDVHTILHVDLKGEDCEREHRFEGNVLGTRYLLAAALEAGVKHVIARSSTFVYGPDPGNPHYLPESWPIRARTGHGNIQDLVQMEGDFREFWGRLRPRPELTVLRFAPIVGPTCSSMMTTYLRRPVLFSVLGFDPLWQFTHEDDVLSAILHALTVKLDGPVNIAGPEVMPISKVAALMGRRRIPYLPVARPLIKALSRIPGISYPTIPTDHLKFLALADTRRMRERFGFTPRHSMRDAIEALDRGLREERHLGAEYTAEFSEFARRALEDILEPEAGS